MKVYKNIINVRLREPIADQNFFFAGCLISIFPKMILSSESRASELRPIAASSCVLGSALNKSM